MRLPEPPRLIVRTGPGLIPFKVRFLIACFGYALRRRRYSRFRISSLISMRKDRTLSVHKFIQFGKYYFAPVLRIPRWPSPAFDRMVAGGGLNLGSDGLPAKTQIDTAILAITRRCPLACLHCYENSGPSAAEDVPLGLWRAAVRTLQAGGASVIVLSGGEPLERFEDLVELLKSGDPRNSDFHIHTSGWGLTPEKARILKEAGLVAGGVALDTADPIAQDRLRNRSGSHEQSVRAVRILGDAGIFPYINMVLSHETAKPDNLRGFLEFARASGAGFVSMYEPKPCGRFLRPAADPFLDESERAAATVFFLKANAAWAFRKYPLVMFLPYFERPELFGCLMRRLSLIHIDSRGQVRPCPFVPVTFGSIRDKPLAGILERMRTSLRHPIRGECPSFAVAEILRAKPAGGDGLAVPVEDIEAEWRAFVSAASLSR
jgi:MoaA/NifB/PqqE/SkfB family radical SAM enzyme